LTNSFYSQKEAELNARISTKRVHVIYHGVPDLFTSLSKDDKEKMAITVGNVERSNLQRKGIEPFVRTAAYFPDIQFVVIGAWADDSVKYLHTIAPSNVVLTGRVEHEELLDYYRKASVYVQASLHEGFGLSVAEAMLAGCIPVVTRRGSLPEVVGDCGFYSASTEPVDLARAIEMALRSPFCIRESARERILSCFPMKKRRELLEEIIKSLHRS
jgi:glycosyltransferase involved in cell wall biosynthesis